jgi:hypothetical protein
MCDADREVCECPISYDCNEVFLIDLSDDLECRAHNALYVVSSARKCGQASFNEPVKAFEADEKTPNMVLHPERMF